MGEYFLTIKIYEVLMSFNVPVAHQPQGDAICLQVGDTVLAIEGNVYVKVSTNHPVGSDLKTTHAKALFDEKFVTINPKIFKLK